MTNSSNSETTESTPLDTGPLDTGLPDAGAHREASAPMALAGLALCLLIAALLSSGRLLTIAERQEFSDSRERWINAAEVLDDSASAVGLDIGADAIERALHDEASSDVVLGDQATTGQAAPITASPTITATPTTLTTMGPPLPVTPTPSAPAPSDVSTTTEPATTTTAPTTTTTPTPTMREITSDAPLRVWAGGDSLGEYVGSRLQYKVADLSIAEFQLDYHISTGLTRPDYFDWPAQLSTTMLAGDDPSRRPEAIIFMAGGNDDQPMRTDDAKLATNSAEWLDEYRRRVATMMDITAYSDVRLYWVGLPPMKDERRESIAVNVNQLIAEEASLRDWVTFIDIVPLLLDVDGNYNQYIVGPDGQSRKAREGDGVHVTARASQWISQQVWDLLLADWAVPSQAPPDSLPPNSEPTTTIVGG